MAIKENIENYKDDVLELIYKIVNDDEIINLKEGNFSHYKLDDETSIDDSETFKSNSAYKNFKESLKKLQLSSMIKKVNTPKIEQSISRYCHENDLLIQSIALDAVFILKPLLNLSVNIIKDSNNHEEEKIQIIREYIEQISAQIKNQTIKKFFSSSGNKKNKNDLDLNESKNDNLKKIINNKKFIEIKDNLEFFNESLIQHLLMWIKLSLKDNNDENQVENLKTKELKEKISMMIDEFFEKNTDEILKRIQF
jgi:hypothetical protein